MQAVILAGGKGTRLAERLHGRPKPLVDVDGVPLLERQIHLLRQHGVGDVVVLVNHAADQIVAFCAAREDFGLDRLTLIDDGEPRGTAGAVLACLDRLDDTFLVAYGDTLFNIDVTRFLACHREARADGTLFLHPNDHPHDSDLVEVDGEGWISAFHPKPHPPGALRPNLVNAAFYALQKSSLTNRTSFRTPSDFGADLFPAMLADGVRLLGYESFEYIKDLGTPKRLDKVVDHLRRGIVARASLSEPQACVFLDRDGTLNELRDYVRRPEDLVLLPRAGKAVRRLNDAEYRVAVTTNQPVIARGECSFAGMRAIHAKLDMGLAEAGAYVDRLYLCPHHPDSGFAGEVRELKVACACRKPEAGMLMQAARDLNADLDRSWMIGDSTSDMAAARKAGVRSILVRTGEAGQDGKNAVRPDFVVDDIAAAADFIVDIYPRLAAAAEFLVNAVRAGDLIQVGGPARSGKSSFSAAIAHGLRGRGLDVATISLDNWIRPEPERTAGLRGRYDLDAAAAALRPWLEGGAAEFDLPFYDRARRRRLPGQRAPLTQNAVLLLEGIPALADAFRSGRTTHKVLVTTDEAGRRGRVVADLVERRLAGHDQANEVYRSRVSDELPFVAETGAAAGTRVTLDDIFRPASRETTQ